MPAEAKSAVQRAIEEWPGNAPLDNTFKVIAIQFGTKWALLTVTPVTRTQSEEYYSVDLEDRFSVLAVDTATGWQAGLEWSPIVQGLLLQIPVSELSTDVRQAIFSGKVRSFDVSSKPPTLLNVTAAPSGIQPSSSYNPGAASAWAGANNRNDGGFYGVSQGRWCTTYIGRAWSAGGLAGASTSWSGNQQIVYWMQANPSLWQFEDRSQLVTGDIILFSSDPNYNDWGHINSDGTSRFGHSAFVNNQGRLSAWNAEVWDKPNGWYDAYGLPYHLGVHITTQQPPGTPTITSPTNGQTIPSLSFNVTVQPGALNYTGQSNFNVIVADNSSFASPIFDNSGGWSSSTTIPVTVPHNGQYWIEVRQGDVTGGLASGWTMESFYVQIQNGVQLLTNGGFEQDMTAWLYNPTGDLNCNHVTTYPGAYEGSKFLATNRDGHPCYSVYQDETFLYPEPGEVYTATFYGRIGWAGVPRTGSIALWALGGNQENNSQSFTLSTTWECFSTTLTVGSGGHNGMRVELYMNDTTPGPDYNFDAVTLERGTQNACPAIGVGQDAGAWNNQTGSFWTDQFNQTYARMNRPAAMSDYASLGSQITANGDALIANPGANRVFWIGWGDVNILKAQGYPFDRVIGQSESWGSLGLVGPPTTDEIYLGNGVYQICFTNGCLNNASGTVTYVPWPTFDPAYWRIDMFNDVLGAGGYSMVHNWTLTDNGWFLNGVGSPDAYLLPSNYQIHLYHDITFAGGMYQFQVSTARTGEHVVVYDQPNATGALTSIVDNAGAAPGQMVYATVQLAAGSHRIFVYYTHTTYNPADGYGVTFAWQPAISTATATPTATFTPTATITPTSTTIPPHIDSIGIYRNGTFYLRLHNSAGTADLSTAFNPATTPYPIVGDWPGSGFDSIGVYDQSNGVYSLRNTIAPGAADETLVFGNPHDTPLSGRWTAAATHAGVGVYRPSNGILYAKNALSTGYSDYSLVLGNPGDQGIAGDWTGIGQDGLGVFRPGNQTFYLVNRVAGNGIIVSDENLQFGGSTDLAIAGDWIGQGHDGIGVFRPSNATVYLKDSLTTGSADASFLYGAGTDLPIAGHWQVAYPPIAPSNVAPTLTPTMTPNNGSGGSVPGGNQIGG